MRYIPRGPWQYLPTDAITGSMLPNVKVGKRVEKQPLGPTTRRWPMTWPGEAGKPRRASPLVCYEGVRVLRLRHTGAVVICAPRPPTMHEPSSQAHPRPVALISQLARCSLRAVCISAKYYIPRTLASTEYSRRKHVDSLKIPMQPAHRALCQSGRIVTRP